MSKVSIEIDGLRFGLRISSEMALKLVEALQGIWLAASRYEHGGNLGDVAVARNAAQAVVAQLTVEIFRSARKSA